MLKGEESMKSLATRIFLILSILSFASLAARSEATDAMKLNPLETRIIGQSNWLRGGPISLRIITTNHQTGKPVNAKVTLTLDWAGDPAQSIPSVRLYSGKTNDLGTLDVQMTAPDSMAGAYRLKVNVNAPPDNDQAALDIQLTDGAKVLLTCDKPLYQPSQTIHMRALALDTATRKAISGKSITFEVEDARGNKVFKKTQELSRFGVASCDFVLADEVNMGLFTLRSILDKASTEKKVRVERYVLPKFKVTVKTDRTWYLPGELIHGTVNSAYFFGKPVTGGKVTAQISTIDVGVNQLKELTGKTDDAGAWKFDYQLPQSFVGIPLEQGKAVLGIHVTLKDTADHQQEANLNVPVVPNPLSIVMIPESASPVPGIDNLMYISVATPDGSPVPKAKLSAMIKGQKKETSLTTDELGLAIYHYVPDAKNPTTIVVNAADSQGHPVQVSKTLSSIPGMDGILLRPDKTIVKVGQKLNMDALSNTKSGVMYLDVIRSKQTILTRAEPVVRGVAHLSMPITPDMVGTLELHAYRILPDENIIRDTRIAIVLPADDLKITASADKTEYRPGADATLHFAVTDQKNQPVTAALGLAMVDESVFALSELQPGLEKTYFLLEKELMEPKYEIHGLEPSFLIHPPMPVGPHPIVLRNDAKQTAAAMLFAAVPISSTTDIRQDTWMTRWKQAEPAVLAQMQKAIQKIMAAVQQYDSKNNTQLTAKEGMQPLVNAGLIEKSDLLDPWGHPYRFNLYGNATYAGYFTISSAGPDGRWDTADDLKDVTQWGINRRFPQGGILVRLGFRGGMGGMADGIGPIEERVMPMAAFKAAAPMNRAVMQQDESKAQSLSKPGSSGAQAPRVREYFPETMYWNPSLITDDNGKAEVKLPMADSITSWRLSVMGNTADGQLGSMTIPVKCFQDFFVDLDLPVALTANDQINIPVACYNYLHTAQNVTLTLDQAPWFTMRGEAKQTIHMDADQVKVVYFPITAVAIGNHALKLTAIGTKYSDAIQKYIDVMPDGRQVRQAINDRLEKASDKTVDIPAEAIQNASSIYVKFYPGTFSQLVEGLDGLLRMPSGCFEQTSSTTYPNVLILDYLKVNQKANPEIQMKADQYINIGYQRLVTFECKNGGFSWFGDEPANQILTAYGLLEFTDMSHVYSVDSALISRTAAWLAGKQNPDGSWDETHQGIAEGIINRQTGALRTTAYVDWALAESGYIGPQLAKGEDYVRAHLQEAKDPYSLAVILNMLVKLDKDGQDTANVANSLIKLAKSDDHSAWWESDTQTFTGARSTGADLETTGLAAYGLCKWGHEAGFVNKVLTHLVESKNSYGVWGSTQGTVWSLKALLYASSNGVGNSKGTVTVMANGSKAATISITPENSDVMQQVNLAEYLKEGKNQISLAYDGDGSLLYQIDTRYYMPWTPDQVQPKRGEILHIDVAYDKTTLAQDDTVGVTVKVKNLTGDVAQMPLIDLGLPPGFTLIPDQLAAAVENKTISKFTPAARQIIIYMVKLGPGEEVTLHYQLRAKYPIKAKTPLSKAYPYYNPEEVAVSQPQELIVR
jgi:hypothetical protein